MCDHCYQNTLTYFQLKYFKCNFAIQSVILVKAVIFRFKIDRVFAIGKQNLNILLELRLVSGCCSFPDCKSETGKISANQYLPFTFSP